MKSIATNLIGSLLLVVGLRIFGDEKPPHFVVIFADDLGYGALDCYGAEYKTPALNELP